MPPPHSPTFMLRILFDGRAARRGVLCSALAAASVLFGCETAAVAPVAKPSVPEVPAQPPSTGEWDRVLQDTLIVGDLVVPPGQRWLVGPGVTLVGNLRTDGGTVAMRPGSRLTFAGANPSQYLGGGMRFDPRFAADFGIWIGGEGVLDVRGTPKLGWNRTGSDSTWLETDEYWIAPTAVDDFTPRRWHPGDPIPQVDPAVPAAEVVNVTRDIVIEGPGHIHISSSKPQTIEYVQLRRMGVVTPTLAATTGRYALHFHFQGEGARGTIVRGVAAVESEGRVFVPHQSHGITFVDNVSVNSFAEGFWWDLGHLSNDIEVDRLAVIGVNAPRERTGQASRFAAIALQSGINNRIRNSVGAGARGGGEYSSGCSWTVKDGVPGVWGFDEGNVCHNNSGTGVRFWTNSPQPHAIRNTVVYRNGIGIQNGAYNNSIQYSDVLSFEDGQGLQAHASADAHYPTFVGEAVLATAARQHVPAGTQRWERVRVVSRGPALVVTGHNSPAKLPMEFLDCDFEAGTGPLVRVDATTSNPWIALFRGCNLAPEDIAWPDPMPAALEGSQVSITDENGGVVIVTVTNGVPNATR